MRHFRRSIRVPVALLAAALLVGACSSGGGSKSGSGASDPPDPFGRAVSVDATKITNDELLSQLKVIAANEAFGKVLKKEDDTVLQPKPGKIDPLVVQAWIDSSINQILGDREFKRRDLEVTPELEATGRKNAEKLFRSKAAFAAFPKSFRDMVVARQARTAALAASFPQDYQPTEAQLQELFTQVQQSCQEGKLVSQIYVDTKEQADAIAAELAGGADFAELARTRSTNRVSAPLGGVAMCIGSTRYGFSPKEIQDAVKATPVGGTTAPISSGGDYVIMRNEPLTFENARELLLSDWHGKHPTALFDFLQAARTAADIQVAKRFATVQRSEGGVAIVPAFKPITL